MLLLTAFGLGFSVHAVTPDRYDTIVDRNIFRLTSPPPPPAPATNNDALDKNIELSGISNFGGQKKAWFIIKTKGAKDTLYINLGENERQEFLEVLNISEEEGEVKVLNAGSPMTLSFKNNAPKAVAGSVPPPAPAGAVATSVIAPVSNNTSSYGGRAVTVTGGNPTVSAGQAGQTAENSTGLRTIPTRTLRLAPVPSQQAATETAVEPQKQRELMEIQKAVYDAAGVAIPPLPPTTGAKSGTTVAPPPVPQ